METLYHDLLHRYGIEELIPGFYGTPRQELNTGIHVVEKYVEKPVKPWMGKKKLSKKQRKALNKQS